MTKEEILEGNKLIAEFMGKNVNPPGIHVVYELSHIYGLYGPKSLLYHSSWDWLMPVVEKIAEKYDVRIVWEPTALNVTYIDRPDINPMDSEIVSIGGGTAMYNTHKAVIAFIKWKNKNKKD